jgi:mannosyl-glycoprotein endo-beta-N-acetylglucosaminidase
MVRIGNVTTTAQQPVSRQVTAQRTPVSMADIRAALSRALQSSTGRPPAASTVDVLAAQVSLETAHGSSMFNYNFGGIKGTSPEGATAHYLTHEVVDGTTVTLDQGFRAYSSLQAGAQDYVATLQARFPGAFGCAASGDVDGFAHALKQSHYYTAAEQTYAAGLRSAGGLGATTVGPPGARPTNVALAAAQEPAVGGAGGPTPAHGPASDFSTSDTLSRVLDAVAASSARIAAPDPQT